MTNIYFTCLGDYRDIEIFNTYHQFVDSGMVTRDDMMRYFALLGRDNGRTPMQWNTSSTAGFTTDLHKKRIKFSVFILNIIFQDFLGEFYPFSCLCCSKVIMSGINVAYLNKLSFSK